MLEKLIAWRQRNLTDKQTTQVLAFFVGILAAVAAFLLHWIIHLIQPVSYTHLTLPTILLV